VRRGEKRTLLLVLVGKVVSLFRTENDVTGGRKNGGEKEDPEVEEVQERIFPPLKRRTALISPYRRMMVCAPTERGRKGKGRRLAASSRGDERRLV